MPIERARTTMKTRTTSSGTASSCAARVPPPPPPPPPARRQVVRLQPAVEEVSTSIERASAAMRSCQASGGETNPGLLFDLHRHYHHEHWLLGYHGYLVTNPFCKRTPPDVRACGKLRAPEFDYWVFDARGMVISAGEPLAVFPAAGGGRAGAFEAARECAKACAGVVLLQRTSWRSADLRKPQPFPTRCEYASEAITAWEVYRHFMRAYDCGYAIANALALFDYMMAKEHFRQDRSCGWDYAQATWASAADFALLGEIRFYREEVNGWKQWRDERIAWGKL